jgi:hypothetical protein
MLTGKMPVCAESDNGKQMTGRNEITAARFMYGLFACKRKKTTAKGREKTT